MARITCSTFCWVVCLAISACEEPGDGSKAPQTVLTITVSGLPGTGTAHVESTMPPAVNVHEGRVTGEVDWSQLEAEGRADAQQLRLGILLDLPTQGKRVTLSTAHSLGTDDSQISVTLRDTDFRSVSGTIDLQLGRDGRLTGQFDAVLTPDFEAVLSGAAADRITVDGELTSHMVSKSCGVRVTQANQEQAGVAVGADAGPTWLNDDDNAFCRGVSIQ